MLAFSFHLSKHHCDFLSSFLYTQSISQVIFPFKTSWDLLIRSLMTRKACKTDQFRAVYLNHWKILRLYGVCFYIFSSLLGLKRSPSLGFVHDCWRHVPHSFSHPAWWGQCIDSCPGWIQLPDACFFRLPHGLDKTSRQSPAHIVVFEVVNSQVNLQQLSCSIDSCRWVCTHLFGSFTSCSVNTLLSPCQELYIYISSVYFLTMPAR